MLLGRLQEGGCNTKQAADFETVCKACAYRNEHGFSIAHCLFRPKTFADRIEGVYQHSSARGRVEDCVSFLDTLLSRKHAPMIGLDISSSSVKLVELSQASTGEYVLERFASESFEKGWIADGQIEKFDEVAEAVRKVITKSGSKIKQVAMAMPQSAVITKKIMLPAGLREEEMELQVEAEANQYIPFSLDEVSLDFCVIGPSATSAGDVDVLIAASRKDRVQDRQALAEAAGLKPAILDIESHASRLAMQRLVAALPGEGKDALVALFEIGADNTSLKVLRDNELLYDRDQAFGGAQLTQLISRQYGFSFEEAETKKLSGDLPEDFQGTILAPFVDSLSQEIGRALQYFFTSTPHHKVHYVMLAGGTAALPGLKERVTDLTGFASMVVNPFEGMKLGSAVRESKLRREAPSYLTACGLAMRRFLA
jgi:type IV pilus assembly protein PilM